MGASPAGYTICGSFGGTESDMEIVMAALLATAVAGYVWCLFFLHRRS